MKYLTHCLLGAALALTVASCTQPQTEKKASTEEPPGTQDPFPPLNATDDIILVDYVEFATLPDIPGQEEAPRPMLLVDEPGTKRLFVNDMRGPLYSVTYNGKTVTKYLDLNDPKWKMPVQHQGTERGFQSFVFHPDFNRRGKPGYGKFYTYYDTSNMEPEADFKPTGEGHTHDTVILEWTARNPAAATYDGGAPKELMRFAQPFGNHNGGQIAFNPLAKEGDEDYGLLYIGAADGGAGGDPYNMAQDLKSAFGKILRIDPMGSNSANGKYGIPASNPFLQDERKPLGEIYAYGIRNVQRLFWDSKTGAMYMSDIGQNAVEEISPVTPGANLGWNVWEGSYRFAGKGRVFPENPRGDSSVVYPVAEYDHSDPILLNRMAVIGGFVYRGNDIPQLKGKLIFGDNPSGEIFYVDADNLPKGGHEALRRVLFKHEGQQKTLLQLIRLKNQADGKPMAERADLRFGEGPDGRIYILNKRDNTIRMLVPTIGQ
jgi:hypothetical protein